MSKKFSFWSWSSEFCRLNNFNKMIYYLCTAEKNENEFKIVLNAINVNTREK